MSFNRPVLAFDTALNGCVACVLTGDRTYTSIFETEREQAARLIPLIQETMKEAGTAFADIGLIVTSVGPGSFTGLRIGLSTARAFSLSLGIPVHGLNSMAVMAASCAIAGDGRNSLVLLETKRSDYYAQIYGADARPLNEPACLSLEGVLSIYAADQILCGDAVERFAAEANIADRTEKRSRKLQDPAILARLGLHDFSVRGGETPRPEPLYLRGADVSVSNKIQRVIEEIPL